MRRRRRAARPLVITPSDNVELRYRFAEEWAKSARARGDFHPPRKDPFDMDFSPARDDYGFKDPKPCVFCEANWDNLDIVFRYPAKGGGEMAIVNPLDPVTPGHVLAIHSSHAANAAADPESAALLMRFAASWINAEGYQANIITSIGPLATQTVMHTHVHVVPRREGDNLPLPWTPQHEVKSLQAAVHLKNALRESGGDASSVGLFQQSSRNWDGVRDHAHGGDDDV